MAAVFLQSAASRPDPDAWASRPSCCLASRYVATPVGGIADTGPSVVGESSGRHKALANFDTCDVATGYFDLRGWASFANLVDTKVAGRKPTDPAVVRVLVGMVMPADSALMLAALQDVVQPPAYGSELNDMRKGLTAKEQLVRHLRTQLMRGLPSKAEQTTLQQLKVQLAAGAVEKVFMTAPLHGRTYVLNCLAAAVPGRDRIISCEEVFELKLPAPDWVALQTRQSNLEGVGEIPLRRLVKEALRMRPDRLMG